MHCEVLHQKTAQDFASGLPPSTALRITPAKRPKFRKTGKPGSRTKTTAKIHCTPGKVPNGVRWKKPVAPLTESAVRRYCPTESRQKLEFPRKKGSGFRLRAPARKPPQPWSWRRDSNPRPSDYKSDALPTELRQQVQRIAAPSRVRIPLIPSECPGQLNKVSHGKLLTQASD